MILEPGLDLIGIESQEPAELHVRNHALLGPGIERGRLDHEAFCQCGDTQVLLHRLSTILRAARSATRLCFSATKTRALCMKCLMSSLVGHCQNIDGFWQ